MSRGPDAATLLRRALDRHADRCGITATWHGVLSRRWASATFVGAQHRIAVTVAGTGLDAWIDGLDEVDLQLRGHLVADVVVTMISRAEDQAELGVEVLTVET